MERVRGYGMRMLGPNCMGVINTDPAICLNASFAERLPPPGRIALASQSGGLGLAVLTRRLGRSAFRRSSASATRRTFPAMISWIR